MSKILLSETTLGNLKLKNHIVMAPMTRSRAVNNNEVNDLVATYYKQRSSAGLIITEGTSPSPNGTGYARIPGIYTEEQVNAWKLVTDKIHEEDGKVFLQIMHTGRISHELNMKPGSKIVAPSAVAAKGEMYTDAEGMKAFPIPKELTLDEIKEVIEEYVQASKNAIKAGFDGVEIHGANGYLLEQFIAPNTNLRKDEYGGSIEKRSKIVLEITEKIIEAIGKDKVGIRLSPFGTASDIHPYAETNETFSYLAKELSKLEVVYIHLSDQSVFGAQAVDPETVKMIRKEFKGKLILCGGYNSEKAEKALENDAADLIAFGRPFISNPDLVERIRNGSELAQPDPNTFYSADEKGYTDYPTLKSLSLNSTKI